MNITALPNELLVNIVGRLDFDSVGSVLFMDRKFYNLVKVHRLYRPIAKEIRIKTVEPSVENPYYMLDVRATLPPLMPQNVNQNRKISKITLKSDVCEGDYEKIEEKLTEMIRKFGLHKMKSLSIDNKSQEFNIIDVIQKAGVGIDGLEMIRTELYIDTPYITNEHIEQLMANNTTQIWFEKCTTGIKFKTILDYIELHFQAMVQCNWHFGIVTISKDESLRLNQIMNIFMRTENGKPMSYSLGMKGAVFQHCLKKMHTKIQWEEK